MRDVAGAGPVLLYHFTHVDHLRSIVSEGLQSDSVAQSRGLIAHEAGDRGVKDRRRSMRVPLPPGGVVADYVPFYFAPRSPMLYVISKGSVDTFQQPLDELVYLCSTVERLIECGLTPLFTRRNAALLNAEFFDDPRLLATAVDWPLMNEHIWRNTPDDGDRMARRAAECLVHDHVPLTSLVGMATMTSERISEVQQLLATLGTSLPVRCRPDWYYER